MTATEGSSGGRSLKLTTVDQGISIWMNGPPGRTGHCIFPSAYAAALALTDVNGVRIHMHARYTHTLDHLLSL